MTSLASEALHNSESGSQRLCRQLETFTTANRELLIALAERHRVPAIYGIQQFPASGGLMSYGPDTVDTVRRRSYPARREASQPSGSGADHH
jgi:hypothetical protein